jgi:aryl-alcohol dehydrogenase-like predicted oxidoreductase
LIGYIVSISPATGDDPMTMTTTTLGRTGPTTARLGLGCMGMSGAYGASDRSESIATIHAAIDAGMTLLDTGDFYGMGHNELLIGETLKTIPRDTVQLSVKFGAQRDVAGAFLGFDSRPAAVKTALAYTLQRLGTDYIDVYRPARLDPNVPIEDTIGAIADMVKAGYVRHIGLSEVGAATIRRAASVHPIVDLQIEYSLISRGPEAEILPVLRELGISVTAYGVLARGLITGQFSAGASFAPDDFRAHTPRFQGDNLAANLKLADKLASLARERGVTAAQIAIAWVLAQGSDIVPLVGARTRARLTESLAALDVSLDKADLDAIANALPPAAGTRYAAAQMAMLDSEKRSTPAS